MASRWFGRTRRSAQEEAAASAARDGAVAAFLDLDTRQRFAAEAVAAVREMNSAAPLTATWKPVEQACFDASAEFVRTSERFPLDTAGGVQRGNTGAAVDVDAAVAAYHQAHRVLSAAGTRVDDFYARYREALDGARSAVAATPRIAEAAVQETLAARQALAQHVAIAGYPSVQAASAAVQQAADELDRAMAAGSPSGIRAAANRIHGLVTEVADTLAAALDASNRAATGLRSVRTRIDAVTTHIERLPKAMSTLLREFSAPNSADLGGTVDIATTELEAGRRAWQKATASLSAGRPEEALAFLAAAREHLAKAAAVSDRLTDRLAALKAVQADPAVAERAARFRIRDCQRLVVDRGLTAQWGTVLDAQSRRVDVALTKLVGPHPNYWAFLSELESVTTFVKGVVERVRAAAQGASATRADTVT